MKSGWNNLTCEDVTSDTCSRKFTELPLCKTANLLETVGNPSDEDERKKDGRGKITEQMKFGSVGVLSYSLTYTDPVWQIHIIKLSICDSDFQKRTSWCTVHHVQLLLVVLPRSKLVSKTDFFLTNPAQTRHSALEPPRFRV